MKKRHLLQTLTYVLLVLLLTACEFIPIGAVEPELYGESEHMDLYTIAAFSVVGADEMGTSVEPIETDAYGRTLFLATIWNPIFYPGYSNKSGSWVYAFGIQQKANSRFTYYYEDDCFCICLSPEDFTEEEQNRLKELNNWDQPLDEIKLTSRKIIEPKQNKLSVTSLGLQEGSSISNHLVELGKRNTQIKKDHVFAEYLDCDQTGQSIGVFWGYSKNDAGEITVEAYFLFAKKDCIKTGAVSVSPISDTLNYQQELKEFKKDNNWRS